MLTTLGKKQWIQNSHKIINATRDLARAINDVPGVKAFGNPEELSCVVAIGLDHGYWVGKQKPNIHAIGDELAKRLGSTLNPIPDGFHICITNNHASNPSFLTNFKKYLRDVA